MTVVYLDSMLLLNAAVDDLLLFATALLAGIPPKRGRYLLAAAVGGTYSAAVFLPGLEVLSGMAGKLVMWILLGAIAFGSEGAPARLILLFGGLSCLMAGAVLALSFVVGGEAPVLGPLCIDPGIGCLLAAGAVVYLLLRATFCGAARHGIRGDLLQIRVNFRGNRIHLTALRDTGNVLRDPVSGAAVLVAEQDVIAEGLPPNVRHLLRGSGSPAERCLLLQQAAPELGARLLPYCAVGVECGLLLGIQSDWTEIEGRRYPGLVVALAPGMLGREYHALWGGETERMGRHGKAQSISASGFGTYGIAVRGVHSLHRGQRYAAPAADSGTGGPAASVSGR